MTRNLLSRSMLFWSGVFSTSTSLMAWAIRPISVDMPVAVTTAVARPKLTMVPMNTMFLLSASGTSSRMGPVCLVARHGLTGEDRFVDLELADLHQQGIGGHLVPALQDDDVAGHDVPGRYQADHAVPSHLGLGRGHLQQGLHGRLGPGFLYVADDGVEQQDHEDDGGIQVFAHHQRDNAGGQQDVDQGVHELLEEGDDGRGLLLPRQLIRTAALPVRPGLLGGEAGAPRVQRREGFLNGELEPGPGAGLSHGIRFRSGSRLRPVRGAPVVGRADDSEASLWRRRRSQRGSLWDRECRRPGSNQHGGCPPTVFETVASAYSATSAGAEEGIRTLDLLLGKEAF